MTDIAVNAEPEQESPDLERERRLRTLNRQLRWRPRDRSRQVARAEAKLRTAKARLEQLEAQLAEARWKAHRYRWVPFLGAQWRKALLERQQEHEAVRSQVRWLEYQLDKARQKARRRQEWDRLHAPELSEREQLRQERQARILELGEAELARRPARQWRDEAMRRAEAEALGREALRRELREQQRQERERERTINR
jgi:multidrug resistance efflux pump